MFAMVLLSVILLYWSKFTYILTAFWTVMKYFPTLDTFNCVVPVS